MAKNIEREMTPEEEAERAQWAAEIEAATQAEQARLEAAVSAQDKLKKLGFTDEEISSLTSQL